MSAGLSVRHGVGDAGLALLDARWDGLLEAQPLPNPTNGAAWLRRVAGEWPGAGPVRVVVVEREGRPVAGGAFWERPFSALGGPRIATFLGERRPGFAPDVLEHPEEPTAARLVMAHLLREVPAFEPRALRVEGPAARALASLTPWSWWRPEEIGGYNVRLPHERIGRRRREVRYEIRRAEKAGATIATSVARGAAVAPALDRLLDLHGRQWGDRPDDTSTFSTREEWRAWHRRAVGDAAARGRAVIGEVREDGRLRASALAMRQGRGALLHTIALDHEGVLRGAGHAAVLAVVEAVTDDGATAIAMGRGQGAHKDRFHPEPDDFVRVLAARDPCWQAIIGGTDRARRSLHRGRARAAPAAARMHRSLVRRA